MAETTINVPGLGATKKTYVYVGAAAVAGILAIAYYRRASQPPVSAPVETGPNPDLVPDSEYESVGSTDTGSWDLTGGTISTNAEWTQRATTYLANTGWSPQFVQTALGAFFQREGLTKEQQDAVKAAIAAFGPPPKDGPWPIKGLEGGDKPPATTRLEKPQNVRVTGVTRNSVSIAWDPVPGATSYAVRLSGQWQGWNATWDYVEGTSYTQSVPFPATSYTIYVQAQGPERSDRSFAQSDLVTVTARTPA